MKLCIFVFSILATHAVLAEDVVTKNFNAAELKSLELTNMSGDIKVTAIDGDLASVTANKISFEHKCKLTTEQQGNKLVVSVRSTDLFDSAICKVHFDVKVPKQIAMNISVGSGDLEVVGTKGQLKFKTGSGDAKIVAEVDSLQVDMGSGDLQIDGLVGSGDLKTGSGDIDLSYTAAPQTGSLNISSGSGSATISLPSGSKLDTSFQSGSGELLNEIGNSKNAKFRISMKAGSGDLRIKKK